MFLVFHSEVILFFVKKLTICTLSMVVFLVFHSEVILFLKSYNVCR